MGSRQRPKQVPFALATLLLAVSDPVAAIPYTPSTVFLAPQYNDSLAYLLQPGRSIADKIEFLSLNISASIDSSNPSYRTLLEDAPFQSSGQTSAFVPVIDNRGTITVYAGDCHDSPNKQAVWQFRPDPTSSTGDGYWSQLHVNTAETQTRPNYLAAGFTFASSDTTAPSMYAFGGMCPFANSTNKDWISTASYSRSMVLLEPTSHDSSSYEASATGRRAPPVPEAGMAIVPLPVTSSATGTERQQDFLLIGGHTRQAFLNMSELAVFSVPQESWSFVTIDSEPRGRTELAVRDQITVTPRSGHAAVLSNDGTKVFVIGGWVGDTSVPAVPQFAVLELGEDYGGTGEWTWTVPASSSEAGIAEGTGLFGHSAAMLPGGVLMIAGGYTIPKQSAKRAASSAERNSQLYLYNTTSGSWVKTYTNPSARPAATSTAQGASEFHGATSHIVGLSSPQKVGLGVGLGLGISLAIILALLTLIHYRKRRVRNQRDSQLRELALGAERAHFWGNDEPHQSSSIRSSQMSEKHGSPPAQSWSPNRTSTGRPLWKDQNDASAERTGLLNDAPSPSRSNPPISTPRSYRHSAYADYRRSDNTGEIHPIDEREEDEAMFRERLMATIPTSTRTGIDDPEDPFSDTPFATPRSTIIGVGLGPFYSRRKDIGSADAEGRVSPTKSDLPSSSLSDASSLSFSSIKPIDRASKARDILMERPLSWASSGGNSYEQLAEPSSHTRETTHGDLQDVTAPSEKSFSTDSYSTAQTTFSQHRAEAESLLHDADTLNPIETSPSKLPSSKPRQSEGLFSSVRRALTLTRRSTCTETESETAQLASGIDRRSTVIAPVTYTGGGSGASTPRRAVSASAELFRRKQGAKDWIAKKRMSDGVGISGVPKSRRDDLFLGAPGYLGDDDTCDDDWDESRRVQMTYTVPREKLRVVNASARDMDGFSERSISRSLSNAASSRRVSN